MQVVLLCWEKHLYDAMIYVYNSGMNDFISPMEVGKLLGAASYLCAHLLIQCVYILLFHFKGEIMYDTCSLTRGSKGEK